MPSFAGSEAASTASDGLYETAPLDGYNANLRGLPGRTPMQIMVQSAATALPAQSLAEQFQRAQQYVGAHPQDFSSAAQAVLTDWGRVAGQASGEAALAARAMFVVEVTKAIPEWAAWSEHDTHFVGCTPLT